MAALNKLTAVQIKAASIGDRLQDGGGLILDRTASGGRWTFRYSFNKRRREMGLGSMPGVSLSAARSARARWQAVLQQGLDPITERKRLMAAEEDERSRTDPTFEDMTYSAFEAIRGSLRSDGKRGRWLSPLSIHVLPKIGRIRISQMHQHHIRDAIAPIWRTKHETASKALARTRIVLRHAKLSGYDVDPFICDAAKHMLGHHEHVETPIPATPWPEIPALYDALSKKPHPSYLALRWIILTATRGESARGARFSEIDGDVWTIPPERMKGKRGKVQAFRVPLSSAAVAVVDECREYARGDLMFPSQRRGFVSVQALTKVLKHLGEDGRPHGFRTSFRTWIQETNAAHYDVAETALAHVIGNKVERSYARSDLLDQRRVLMQKWADYVTQRESVVVKLSR